MWHSCVKVPLADHFRGKQPIVRRLFDRLRALIRRCGPATMYAQKTRIVFMGRVRFAGAATRRSAIDAGLWLKRRAGHPCLRRVETPLPRDFVHTFRFTDPGQMDQAFARLVREACSQGLPAATGLGMLVEQAALSFAIWTGRNPPRESLFEAVDRAPG